MKTYTNVYTYNKAGISSPHDDINDACAWLGYHLDDDETVMVTKVEFDEETDEIVWAWDITKAAAEKLGDYWKECEDMMTENPHPLAETFKGFDIDDVRFDVRRGV